MESKGSEWIQKFRIQTRILQLKCVIGSGEIGSTCCMLERQQQHSLSILRFVLAVSGRAINFFASSVVFSDVVLKAPQYVRSLVDTPTELQVWNSHGLQGLCNVLFQILPLAEDQHLFACCPLDLLNPCPMASPRLLMLLRSMTKSAKDKNLRKRFIIILPMLYVQTISQSLFYQHLAQCLEGVLQEPRACFQPGTLSKAVCGVIWRFGILNLWIFMGKMKTKIPQNTSILHQYTIQLWDFQTQLALLSTKLRLLGCVIARSSLLSFGSMQLLLPILLGTPQPRPFICHIYITIFNYTMNIYIYTFN